MNSIVDRIPAAKSAVSILDKEFINEFTIFPNDNVMTSYILLGRDKETKEAVQLLYFHAVGDGFVGFPTDFRAFISECKEKFEDLSVYRIEETRCFKKKQVNYLDYLMNVADAANVFSITE